MAAKSTVPAGSGRKSARDPMDRYYTPWPVALGVCQEWRHAIEGRDVLDPFAGGGVWLRAALTVGATSARGVDLDEGAPAVLDGRAVLGDGLAAIREACGVAICTNPPFALMNEAILAMTDAWLEGRVSAVVLLCRITTMEGVKRVPIWRRAVPERTLTTARRMEWEGPGGDMLGGVDNFGAAGILWGQRTAHGDTRTILGWEPEPLSQVGLFTGGR